MLLLYRSFVRLGERARDARLSPLYENIADTVSTDGVGLHWIVDLSSPGFFEGTTKSSAIKTKPCGWLRQS